MRDTFPVGAFFTGVERERSEKDYRLVARAMRESVRQ
jgi:hypothetical protein